MSRRRLAALAAITVFTVASALCGVATSLMVLGAAFACFVHDADAAATMARPADGAAEPVPEAA